MVRDGGDQIYGQSVCSALLQGGWSENAAVEQQAATAAQQAQQQAQQQASASAQAQALASAQAATESNATSDLDDLESTNGDFTDAAKITSDVTSTDNDLSHERSDIANGNGDYCYNIQGTVDYDATGTINYDVLGTASYDVSTEQTAITNTRQQITTVEQDQAALRTAGLPATPGAASALSRAQEQTGEAVATANKDIDELNADLSDAYRLANSAGTGDCAGDGPGSAPSGLPHLS
ncbi:hypothetical protein GXW82_14940 [Streptacidiphilus sp. 4-A2]|nr:hypothetical protein [Streptacidiphilus sp. 4-A2]